MTDSMSSRERVLCAFDHEEPDRVPRWCGASPEFRDTAKRELGLADDEALSRRFGDDFRRVFARYAGPEFPLAPGSVSRTVFGVERHGLGYGQPVSHPLAGADERRVREYPWPDPLWQDVSGLRDRALRWNRQFAMLGGDWSPFWHDAIDLFGMEKLLLNMHDEPQLVDAALARLVDYYAGVSARIFDAAGDALDVFFVGNDFGSRMGPLVGPALFERFLLPHLRRLVGLGHDYGLRVQLHCCGGIEPLIPLLIRTELDGLHAVQPSCHGMDLATLKRRYGDRILFNGAIDSHHVLIDGDPGRVRRVTLDTLDIMAPGGGYVAGASHDYLLAETPVENVAAMFDAVEEWSAARAL